MVCVVNVGFCFGCYWMDDWFVVENLDGFVVW